MLWHILRDNVLSSETCFWERGVLFGHEMSFEFYHYSFEVIFIFLLRKLNCFKAFSVSLSLQYIRELIGIGPVSKYNLNVIWNLSNLWHQVGLVERFFWRLKTRFSHSWNHVFSFLVGFLHLALFHSQHGNTFVRSNHLLLSVRINNNKTRAHNSWFSDVIRINNKPITAYSTNNYVALHFKAVAKNYRPD